MLLSTNTAFARFVGFETAVRLLLEAGFDAIDMSFGGIKAEDSPFRAPDFRAFCEKFA